MKTNNDMLGGRAGFRRTNLLLSCIAALLAVIALELSDRLPSHSSVAVAQIPDTGRQRQDIVNESRRTNELLTQILEHLQGKPVKVVMESPDKARGEAAPRTLTTTRRSADAVGALVEEGKVMQRNTTRRPAFTMTELAISAVVVSILCLAALPNREADDHAKLESAATGLESDIGYARSLALVSPTDPVVLRVNLEQDYYWVARKSAPDTPVTNPATRKSYVVKLGRSGDASVRDVSITADNFKDHTLEFNSSGGVVTDGSVGMEFALGKNKRTLRIAPGSGSTKQLSSDLASAGMTNVVAEPAESGGNGEEEEEDDGGLLGGLLGGLGL